MDRVSVDLIKIFKSGHKTWALQKCIIRPGDKVWRRKVLNYLMDHPDDLRKLFPHGIPGRCV